MLISVLVETGVGEGVGDGVIVVGGVAAGVGVGAGGGTSLGLTAGVGVGVEVCEVVLLQAAAAKIIATMGNKNLYFFIFYLIPNFFNCKNSLLHFRRWNGLRQR